MFTALHSGFTVKSQECWDDLHQPTQKWSLIIYIHSAVISAYTKSFKHPQSQLASQMQEFPETPRLIKCMELAQQQTEK